MGKEGDTMDHKTSVATDFSASETSEFVTSVKKRPPFAEMLNAGRIPVYCSKEEPKGRQDCLMSLK